jgi:Putative Actinobacterial Holin-X, holin superfamily III
MPEGLAFLVVGAVYAVAAAVLLPKGKNKLSQVRPIPEKSAETVREDVQWARRQMS